MTEYLKRALKENSYKLPKDFDDMDRYNELKTKGIATNDLISMIVLYLKDAKQLVITLISGESMEKELLLECICSFELFLTNLMDKSMLIDVPLKMRTLFDNILKFYKYKKLRANLSDNALKIMDYCGAESHLGSVLSKNLPQKLSALRDTFLSKLYKDSLFEITSIFADMIVKEAKVNNSVDFCAIIAPISICSLIAGTLVLEADNEIDKS